MQNIFIISAGSFTMNGLPVKYLSIIFLAALNLIQSNLAHACWEDAAQKYGMQPQLLYAIAKTESGFNPNAMNQNKKTVV